MKGQRAGQHSQELPGWQAAGCGSLPCPLPAWSCQTWSRWFHPHPDKALSTGLTWEAEEMCEQLHIPSVIACFPTTVLWPVKTSEK